MVRTRQRLSFWLGEGGGTGKARGLGDPSLLWRSHRNRCSHGLDGDLPVGVGGATLVGWSECPAHGFRRYSGGSSCSCVGRASGRASADRRDRCRRGPADTGPGGRAERGPARRALGPVAALGVTPVSDEASLRRAVEPVASRHLAEIARREEPCSPVQWANGSPIGFGAGPAPPPLMWPRRGPTGAVVHIERWGPAAPDRRRLALVPLAQ